MASTITATEQLMRGAERASRRSSGGVFRVGAITIVALAGCVESLPTLPPTQPVVQQLVTVEGGRSARRRRTQRARTHAVRPARGPRRRRGTHRRERLYRRRRGCSQALRSGRLSLLIFDAQEPMGSPPIGRHRYTLPSNTSGQVLVDITVGAAACKGGFSSQTGRALAG